MAKTFESLEDMDKFSLEMRLMKTQMKATEQQAEFSKIVMLATVVLAFGTFLTLILTILEFNWSEFISSAGISWAIFFSLCFFVLFCLMAYTFRVMIRNHMGK